MLKKNSIILSVIAVAVLLLAVIGASFAYFSVIGENTSATTNVNVLTPVIGLVGTTGSKELTLNVTATQMNLTNKGKKYYAVEETESISSDNSSAQNITLATMTATGGNSNYTYNCSGTLTIKLGEELEENGLKDSLVNNSLFFDLSDSNDGIIFSEDVSNPIDLIALKTDDSITKDFTYTLTGGEEGNSSKTLKGDVYLQNNGLGENGDLDGADQKALAGKNINIVITVTTTSCTVS